MQWKVINFWRKCENFATFLHQFHIECINNVQHKTDFTSARLQNSLIAAVKSRLQWAFILPLVFWHKLPSPSSELQFMTNFPIYTQVFKGYSHYSSTILSKFSLLMIWGYVEETTSIFRGKKKKIKITCRARGWGSPRSLPLCCLCSQPANVLIIHTQQDVLRLYICVDDSTFCMQVIQTLKNLQAREKEVSH